MDLPRGKRVLSEKIENIATVYDRIPADFRGLIRIFMKYEGRLHSGDLLIDDKRIIGISLDDLDKNKSVFGEEAFGEIKARISEAKGDVDLHRFSDVEMSLALTTNERILMRPGLPIIRFKELGVVSAAPAETEAAVTKAGEEVRSREEARRRVEEELKRREERRRLIEETSTQETEEDRRMESEKRAKVEEEEQRKREEDSKRRSEEDRRQEEAKRKEEELRRKEEDLRRREEEEKKRVGEGGKKPEEEEWMKELGKLDEEWGKLEEEWKKLESIKGLSLEEGAAAPKAAAVRAELSEEDKAVLATKPSLTKSIGFADRLRLLRFPNASNAVGMMKGQKTIAEVADELKIDRKVLADLVKELNKRGYIK